MTARRSPQQPRPWQDEEYPPYRWLCALGDTLNEASLPARRRKRIFSVAHSIAAKQTWMEMVRMDMLRCPDVALIAHEHNVSIKLVRDCIKWLEDNGWLVIVGDCPIVHRLINPGDRRRR
jgi:hypothetical protein